MYLGVEREKNNGRLQSSKHLYYVCDEISSASERRKLVSSRNVYSVFGFEISSSTSRKMFRFL